MIDMDRSVAKLWSAATVCAGLLMTQVAGAHPAAFTINEVMQAPYPSDLVAAPSGGAVAWVFDTKGCRNILVADSSGAAKARPITAFTEDDGFDIGDLAWSPDTNSIAFTRAQTLEDEAPANVGSTPEGPKPREVWVVSTSGGPAHKVGTGHSASFSPDGSRLVFADRKTIQTVAANGEGGAQPLIVDEGGVSSLTWSPDGKRLAFVSHRGSHSLIGVYEVGSRTVVWMNPSLDDDSSPAFSPDGARTISDGIRRGLCCLVRRMRILSSTWRSWGRRRHNGVRAADGVRGMLVGPHSGMPGFFRPYELECVVRKFTQ
jgi:Tol biopolymer transport system component